MGTLIMHLLCLLTHREYITFPISKETSKHIKFFKLSIPHRIIYNQAGVGPQHQLPRLLSFSCRHVPRWPLNHIWCH